MGINNIVLQIPQRSEEEAGRGAPGGGVVYGGSIVMFKRTLASCGLMQADLIKKQSFLLFLACFKRH